MTPVWQTPDVTAYVGDVRAVLGALPEKSVHVVITSPPYWGLRSYAGVEPSVWGGDPGCLHEWGEQQAPAHPGQVNQTKWANVGAVASGQNQNRGRVCCRCGAFLGCLGLEPLHDCGAWARRAEPCPACFICHLRTVFAAVWRVLRDDGTCWVNIGDSYAGSGKGPTGHNGIGDQEKRQGFVGGRIEDRHRRVTENHPEKRHALPGLKAKDRVGIPERLALALQADGWYWRDKITLCKTSPMPESVRDRTTQATEMLYGFAKSDDPSWDQEAVEVLVLAKRERYFWDSQAVRQPNVSDEQAAHNAKYAKQYDAYDSHAPTSGQPGNVNNVGIHSRPGPGGRNPRNWMLWKPEPSAVAHYATFPRFLPRFAILAGTAERVCGACGKPWERVTETRRSTFEAVPDPTMHTGRRGLNRPRTGIAESYVLAIPQQELARQLAMAAVGRESEMRSRFGWKWDHWTRTDPSGARIPTFEDAEAIESLLGMTVPFNGAPGGFRPTCRCGAPAIPATVLDPFSGSGTVQVVARELGRRSIYVDASAEYAALAAKRLEGVPLSMGLMTESDPIPSPPLARQPALLEAE